MSQMQRVIPAPSMTLAIDLHLQGERQQLPGIPPRELSLLAWADSLDEHAIALGPRCLRRLRCDQRISLRPAR